MRKAIAMIVMLIVVCGAAVSALGVATDSINGHYWESMFSDSVKSDFLLGYMLGIRHEMDVVSIFTNSIVRKRDAELADALIDFLNNNIQNYGKLELAEYVKFLNECYRADKRNLNIPIVSMITFAVDSENMTRKEIKARLQELSEIFADKDRRDSR